MKPVFQFLVSPLEGKRYDNTHKLATGGELILSVSQEDHTVTQRYATVLGIPFWYDGGMEAGDTVIVHHNVFRKFYGTDGKEKDSSNYIRDDVYAIGPDEFFLYRKPGGNWQAPNPYIFVSPVPNADNRYTTDSLKLMFGKVEYSCCETIPPGSMVSFQPDCEYEFKIDGRILYRMYKRNITLMES